MKTKEYSGKILFKFTNISSFRAGKHAFNLIVVFKKTQQPCTIVAINLIYVNYFKDALKNEDSLRFYSLGRIRMSSLGQRGSVGQKVTIAGFLDRIGHLGGEVLAQ